MIASIKPNPWDHEVTAAFCWQVAARFGVARPGVPACHAMDKDTVRSHFSVDTLRQNLSPFLRGSLFYGAYWGIVGLYQPFAFVYFSQRGISSEQIGWLSAIFALCVLLVSPLVSRLADRTNLRVPALAICVAGYGAMLVVLPAARDFLPLALLYLILNVFHAPIGPVADSLVVRMAAHHRLNFGGMRLWGSLIFAAISAVAGLVWQSAGYGVMFPVSGVLMVLVAGAAMLLSEGAVTAEDASPQHAGASTAWWRDVRFMLMLASLFLIGATFAMAWTFESIYVTYLGGSQALIGGMIGLSALCELPPMLYTQRLMRRIGDINTLLLAFLMLGLSYFGYWLADGTWSILAVNVVKGLGFGLFYISAVVIVDRRAPHGLASTYQGLMSAVAFGLAPVLIGPVGGWIYGTFEPRSLFLVSGFMVIAAGLVLIPVLKR